MNEVACLKIFEQISEQFNLRINTLNKQLEMQSWSWIIEWGCEYVQPASLKNHL